LATASWEKRAEGHREPLDARETEKKRGRVTERGQWAAIALGDCHTEKEVEEVANRAYRRPSGEKRGVAGRQ
jgi:hypothetical protein